MKLGIYIEIEVSNELCVDDDLDFSTDVVEKNIATGKINLNKGDIIRVEETV